MVDIRRKLRRDEATIESLSARAFDEYTPGAGPRTVEMTRHPEAFTRIAVSQGAPVGFTVVRLGDRDVAHLDAIAVSDPARGRGVGRALLERAERDARARGATTMRLVTAEANLSALELFLSVGFRVERRVARYYPRGQNAVVMRKTL